jgi:hypothetical protein
MTLRFGRVRLQFVHTGRTPCARGHAERYARGVDSAFVCRRCGGDITGFLQRREADALQLVTGVWVVPAGRFVRLDRDLDYATFVTCGGQRGSYRSPDGEVLAFQRGDFLLHEDDVRGLRIAKGATGGCCGLQPRGEANLTCPCGHPVATLHGDECWSPLVVRLWGDRVDEVAMA